MRKRHWNSARLKSAPRRGAFLHVFLHVHLENTLDVWNRDLVIIVTIKEKQEIVAERRKLGDDSCFAPLVLILLFIIVYSNTFQSK